MTIASSERDKVFRHNRGYMTFRVISGTIKKSDHMTIGIKKRKIEVEQWTCFRTGRAMIATICM
jgi:hypothetical protein